MSIVIHSVGVIGASGDLGGQLCVQLVAANLTVRAYAHRPGSRISTILGADLFTTVRSVNQRITWQDTVTAVLNSSELVHWCAPLAALDDLQEFPDGVLLVLHDSVMQRSLAAKNKLQKRFPDASVAIVHCLMNKQTTVVVADEHNQPSVHDHFSTIGMRPAMLSVVQHDRLMAHSQAPLAILCALLLDELRQHDSDGLLTNSGQALFQALQDRSAHWTDNTLAAILDNPELPTLLGAMKQLLDKNKV